MPDSVLNEVQRMLGKDPRIGLVLAEILGPPAALQGARERLWEGDDG